MRAGGAAAGEDSRQTRREGEKEKEEEGEGVEKKDDALETIKIPHSPVFSPRSAQVWRRKKKYEIAPKTSAKRSPCIGSAFGSVLVIGEAILRPTGNPCVGGTISLKKSL